MTTPRFRFYSYDQDILLAINFRHQLQSGTFEHALHYLIEHKLDLSIFHPKYRNQDTGRKAYHPAILLKIILFAYSKGITSSREIQWCCETNILFKALSCDTVPHFTTIAAFVSQHSEAVGNAGGTPDRHSMGRRRNARQALHGKALDFLGARSLEPWDLAWLVGLDSCFRG